jgi:hypothetical protein
MTPRDTGLRNGLSRRGDGVSIRTRCKGLEDSMKTVIRAAGLVLTVWAAVSCGPKPQAASGPSPANRLSANELAGLLDFHAWKLRIPQSQQPCRSVQLVTLKADGTRILEFGAAQSIPPASCTNILLGLRCADGRFVGRLELQDTKGTQAWSLSFTNASEKRPRSWVVGSPQWNGKRAELATFWSEAPNANGGGHYSTLAVELVR